MSVLTSESGKTNRLLSLDLMRGLIMVLLAAESCRIYESMHDLTTENSLGDLLITQFFHHPWHGLRFWDLVQPAFMFMAGSAMCISFLNKLSRGVTWSQNLKHIGIRCVKLLLFGTALHCLYAGKLVWELWNVLAQLSVTTMIAYLIIRKSYAFQVCFSIGLLLLTEVLYRYTSIPGFDQPFVQGENFGSYMDTVLMNKINSGGWVAINFIPTAAHTIWGVLAGKLLASHRPAIRKIRILIIAGAVGLLAGYSLDLTVTPIIKRISTTSFTLVSGGWVLWILAFLYWLTDVKRINKFSWIFVVVGMNAIFIYLFFETIGHQWLNGAVMVFVGGVTALLGMPETMQALLSAIATLILEWYLCYWLFKRGIFFKI